jgi:hypothetical protein
MNGLGSDRTGGGAQDVPLCGADDSAQGTSPFGRADGVVTFLGQRGRLGLLVV